MKYDSDKQEIIDRINGFGKYTRELERENSQLRRNLTDVSVVLVCETLSLIYIFWQALKG